MAMMMSGREPPTRVEREALGGPNVSGGSLDLDAGSTLHDCCMSMNTAPHAASQTGSAIRVRGLEKAFKELHVLRGVDFDVDPGSIFALLGSNGAGKTTVVRSLAPLL
jgi:ABC-type glutathione transport system ATPase component